MRRCQLALCIVLLAALAGCPSSRPVADGSIDRGPVADRGTAEGRGDLGQPDSLLPDTKPRPPARWDTVAPLAQGRMWHTLTALDDGTLLAAGGMISTSGYQGLKSAERYDPKSNKWTAAGEMSQAHFRHRAVRLKDGRVLVIGGCGTSWDNSCMIGVGADLYDPKTNSWSKANAMLVSRLLHAATRLLDGRVLVLGGHDNLGVHTSLEIYDPQAGTWGSPAATLSTARLSATATTLPNGKVAIIGGSDDTKALASIEVFDPATGAITKVAATLKQARFSHTATLLNDGRVLVVGGACMVLKTDVCTVDSVEIYDPATDKTATAGSVGKEYWAHTATLLLDGRVLAAGGEFGNRLVPMLYTPAGGGSWSQTASLKMGRYHHAAALTGEQVVVAGGWDKDDNELASVEIYTP